MVLARLMAKRREAHKFVLALKNNIFLKDHRTIHHIKWLLEEEERDMLFRIKVLREQEGSMEMNHIDSKRLIELLIDYFETGNSETDTVAKMILKSSPDFTDYWKGEAERIQAGIHWTGIRAVEAEMFSHALRELQRADYGS